MLPNLLIIGNQIQVIEPHDVDDTHLVWYATSLDGVDPALFEILLIATDRDIRANLPAHWANAAAGTRDSRW